MLADWNTALVWLGSLYLLKLTLALIINIKDCLNAYILPRILSPINYVETYGQWAVVTGCTQGIGKVYAELLAKRGMNIVLVSRSISKLEQIANEIHTQYKVETMVMVADFTSADVLPLILDKIKQSKIDVGVLVNNVGINPGGHSMPFFELDAEAIKEAVTVNVLAATMLCHGILPDMKRKGKGAVINISSLASVYPMPYMAVYAATKAYISSFTEAITAEYSDYGIVIQNIDPGQVQTAMTEHLQGLPKFIHPKVTDYVESAIKSLGFTNRTCGWWGHSLMLTVGEWVLPAPFIPVVTKREGRRSYYSAIAARPN